MKVIEETTGLKPEYDIGNIAPWEDVLFFDIETTGLKKETTQVYLIGCGFFKDGDFCVRQWLTESALDEARVLDEFLAFAAGFKVLVHFNGDGFDIPYLSYKADAYGMDFSFDAFESYDIYKKIRPLRSFLGRYHLNQTSVEEFLGIKRDDEMNGGVLIPYYYEYEKTGDEQTERLLLLHNHDDIIGMLKIVDVLAYPDVFDGKFGFRKAFAKDGAVVMEYELDTPVKTAVDYEKNGLTISLEGRLLQISVPVKDGVVRIPVSEIRDYYYLPAEDTVIHKDVAGFVDKKHRCRATRENAYVRVAAEMLLGQNGDYFYKTALAFLRRAL